MKDSSTERVTDEEINSRPSLPFRIVRTFVKILARPTIVGHLDPQESDTIYVLNFRSLTDLALLQVATEKIKFSNPLAGLSNWDETSSFFCLRRSTGFRRRLVIFKFSERFKRLHQKITINSSRTLCLVPVSIFWARVKPRERSFSQALFSERSNLSLGFRRGMCLVFGRHDILIQFGEPIPWQAKLDPQESELSNFRHVARHLRAEFNDSQTQVLGPRNPSARRLRQTVFSNSRLEEFATKAESRTSTINKQARRYLRTIRTKFSYPFISLGMTVLGPFWRRSFAGFEVYGLEVTKKEAASSTLVYVPNHRSHMDYVLLSWVLHQHGVTIPHVASGDNLNLPLVGGILRRLGAFFIKRSYHDLEVYRRILEAYVYELLNLGNSLEFFIEGSRSRTGWIQAPQFGLVRLLLDCEQRGTDRPIKVIPVHVAYQKLLEISGHVSELEGRDKKGENLFGILRNILRMSRRMGTLAIRFGDPMELSSPMAEDDRSLTKSTAYQIIHAINDRTMVNATHLVCLALSGDTNSVDKSILLRRIDFLQTLLRADSLNHDYVVARSAPHELLEEVSYLFEFDISNTTLDIPAELATSMFWYRNNVVHTIFAPALCMNLLRTSTTPLDRMKLISEANQFLGFFGFLLNFRFDETAVERWLQHLINSRLIVVTSDSETLSVAGDHSNLVAMFNSMINPWMHAGRELVNLRENDGTSNHLDKPSTLADDLVTARLQEIADLLPMEFNLKSVTELHRLVGEYFADLEESSTNSYPPRNLLQLFNAKVRPNTT